MSYGLKFNLQFRDDTFISNKLWQINIYENGYAGSTKSVTGDDSPVQISYKKGTLETAICGSECTVSLLATTAGEFDEFLTAAPLQYYIDVQWYNGTSWDTYWSGVNTTDCYTQQYGQPPYQVALKFNCGLGELQWHRYENAGQLTTGIETILEVISNCMTFLPFPNKTVSEIINVREDTTSDSAGFLEQVYVNDIYMTEIGDDGETHGWNCNKLLNAILSSINCRMYQSANSWFVERIYERVNATVDTFTYQTYDTWQTANDWLRGGSWAKGVEIDGVSLKVTVDNASFPRVLGTSEKAVTQLQPILTYKFDTSNIANLQLIPSPFLEDTPLSKDANGRPLRWDPTNSTGGQQTGWPFTCSAGGTVLTFATLAGVEAFPFGSPIQIYVGGNFITRKVVSNRSGLTTQINAKFDNVTTSATTVSLAAIGGDGLETIDVYDTNIQYQSGYSFGPKVYLGATDYVNSYIFNTAYMAGNFQPYGTAPYSQHAVRNTGDRFTQPYVMLDPDNGQVNINIREYVRFKVTPQYTGVPSYTQTYNDAMSLLSGGPNFYSMYKILFVNQADTLSYWYSGQGQIQGGGNEQWNPGIDGLYYMSLEHTFLELNANFPYQAGTSYNFKGPQNGGITLQMLQNMFAASWVKDPFVLPHGGYVEPFYICFDTSTDLGGNMNSSTGFPFPSTPQPYSFDFDVYPPFMPNNGVFTQHPGTCQVTLDDWAIKTVDIQYKDNAQSATSNIDFYSSNAGDTRWNELTVTAQFGDTDSIGYPGSFCVYTGYNTGTWHNKGAGDTGQTLVDIFFKNFAQIPATYRNNLKGNTILAPSLAFWQSVEDEDGTLYIQLGHTLEVKLNTYTTDMEGMADLALPITPIHSVPTTGFVTTHPILTTAKHITPLISPTALTQVAKTSGTLINSNRNYPLLKA